MDTIKINFKAFVEQYFDTNEIQLFEVLNKLPDFANYEKIWLGGGAIRRAIQGEKKIVSDLDFFFDDLNSQDAQEFEQKILQLGFKKESETAHVKNFYDGQLELQFVKINTYENVDQLLDSFDFTICQFVTDGNLLYTTPQAILDLGQKRLNIHKISYPVSSMRRIIKYCKQGFYACEGTLINFLKSVNADQEFVQAIQGENSLKDLMYENPKFASRID